MSQTDEIRNSRGPRRMNHDDALMLTCLVQNGSTTGWIVMKSMKRHSQCHENDIYVALPTGQNFHITKEIPLLVHLQDRLFSPYWTEY